MAGRATSLRVLLLEDEALIALAIEDELVDAGYEVVGPFDTCTTALAWLGGSTPDLAVLDVALRDGPCTELALLLQDRGVPFVVYSGHRPSHADAELRGAVWIEKPAPKEALVQALRALGAPGG